MKVLLTSCDYKDIISPICFPKIGAFHIIVPHLAGLLHLPCLECMMQQAKTTSIWKDERQKEL